MKMRGLLGLFTIGVAATLVVSAGATPQRLSQEAGLVVLNASADGALSLSGASRIEMPVPAVYVNSSSQRAILTNGTAILDTPNLYVVGNARFSGGSGCTGQVHTSSVPYANPCAGFSVPPSSDAPARGAVNVNSNAPVSLEPGRYTGSVRISGGGTVTMAPGVYFIENGMSINAGSIRAEGVTIILASGDLNMSSSGTITMSPPTSGPTAGMVVTATRQCTGQLTLSGGAGAVIQGTIYAPTQVLTLSGNSSLTGQGPQMGDLVVADRVRITGTAIMRIGSPNAPPITLLRNPQFD